MPYAPLGRGFLTGSITGDTDLSADWRGGLARFSGTARDANLALVDVVRRIARDLTATPAQVALAWLRHRGAALGLGVVPIPGTRRPARVDENLGSLALTLDEDAMAALDGLGRGRRRAAVRPRRPGLGVRDPRNRLSASAAARGSARPRRCGGSAWCHRRSTGTAC